MSDNAPPFDRKALADDLARAMEAPWCDPDPAWSPEMQRYLASLGAPGPSLRMLAWNMIADPAIVGTTPPRPSKS